jgi:hypothetical protein
MSPTAEFYRGPHDGLVLNLEEITRYCHMVKTVSEEEERIFAMMPTLVEWKHVMRGRLDKDGPFDTLHPYELMRRGDKAAFMFRRNDEFIVAAGGN